MVNDQDPIFDIIHSLPVVTHSVALATRTPTKHYPQKSMFTPDYGGVLETPNSKLKNNALASKLPFRSKSNLSRLVRDETESEEKSCAEVTNNDCLIVTSDLKSVIENSGFYTIRAIGKNLYLNTISKEFNQSSLSHGAYVIYKNNITGIKQTENMPGSILVKFANIVKTIRLDESSQNDVNSEQTYTDHHGKQVSLKALNTVKERTGLQVKDACLNHFNKSIQGVASDNFEFHQVKLYDLSSNQYRKSFHTIKWSADEISLILANEKSSHRSLRNRTVRTFASVQPAIRGIQQIDNIPSHLVNMLLTTDCQTLLIDPRLDELGQIYVDRANVSSFYPIEFIKRTEFSRRNGYQFYSLSNVHLRVFDTRYPGMPLNQLNHMLDSSTYDAMNLKIIDHAQEGLETLCSSSYGRLCFITFDQSQEGTLINPKSVHLPYHDSNAFDPGLDKNPDEMFGLGVSVEQSNSSSDLFSVLQLTREGHICMREFVSPEGDLVETDDRAELILQQVRALDIEFYNRGQKVRERNFEERNCLESELVPKDVEYIDIVDENVLIDFQDKLGSRRALDRFEKMRSKLEGM